MSDVSEQGAHKKLAPPYVPYPSFQTMIGGFKEHGLPSRIDRSVLTNFSGITGSQLITSLKFLGLIDAHNHPQEALRTLVSAFGTPQWPNALGGTLKSVYAPIFELNLKSASPSQFNERFKKDYPGENSTLRKNITFFLGAAKDAEIEISPYITKNKKPRSGPSKRRAKSNGEKGDTNIVIAEPKVKQVKQGLPTPLKESAVGIADKLLEKFPAFDPAWPDPIKTKWFEGYERLLEIGVKK